MGGVACKKEFLWGMKEKSDNCRGGAGQACNGFFSLSGAAVRKLLAGRCARIDWERQGCPGIVEWSPGTGFTDDGRESACNPSSRRFPEVLPAKDEAAPGATVRALLTNVPLTAPPGGSVQSRGAMGGPGRGAAGNATLMSQGSRSVSIAASLGGDAALASGQAVRIRQHGRIDV